MKLLDTTFLIDYWAGDEDAGAFLDAHEETDEFVTTPITVKELAGGRRRQERFDERELASTFDWVRVVPFDRRHAYEAAALAADLWDSDRTRRQVEALAGDVLVAGAARALDATVVTRNTEDFEQFDGVTPEGY